MNVKKIYIIFLIVILGSGALFSNWKVYRTSTLEFKILNKKDIKILEHDNQFEDFYPSLAFNSVPLETYVSEFYSTSQLYEEAINTLKNSLVQNPYCLYTRYLLSRNYIFKEDFEQAELILEDLFILNPNIESISALYFSLLGEMGNEVKLLELKSSVETLDNKLINEYFYTALRNSRNK